MDSVEPLPCNQSADSEARLRELRASEAGFSAIVAQIAAGIAVTDLTGRFVQVNERYCEIVGYTEDELYVRRLQDLTHPDDLARNIEMFERLVRDGTDFVIEKRYLRKNGTTVWVSNSVLGVRDSNDDLCNALAVSIDITERKRSEVALRNAEQQLRDFVENANVPMHWVGPDGTILWANRAELDMLGFTPEEYIRHHIAEFHADQSVVADILQRKKNREALDNYEARLRCKDGSIRHVLINSTVYWEGDKFVHTRSFTRDITERKRGVDRTVMLAREAEHRAKNMLATVQATVHLTQSDTADDLKRTIEGRIQALANVHRLFVETRWRGANLHSLAEQELAAYCQHGETRARINGPDILLEPNAAQAIAVSLHELATNAAKYGALSVQDGRVEVEWSIAAEGRLVLRWIETGGPPVEPPTHRGFGTRVMKSLVTGQLKGDMQLDWRPEGLACEIVLAV